MHCRLWTVKRLSSSHRFVAVAAGVVLLVLAAGLVDLRTGVDIQVLALYFAPLLLAGWELDRPGAVATAIFATVVWLFVQHASTSRAVAWYVWAINAVTQGTGFLIVAVLVAHLRRSLRRERLLSRIDPLTGLQNRRALLESATRALAVCRRHGHAAGVIVIDLNNFKSANDTHGHAYGDQLLVQSARIFREITRESDIVARLGGDEFAIFLPETYTEQATALLVRIVERFEVAGEFLRAGVSISAGVASEDVASSDLGELLRRADHAMYETKRQRAAPTRSSASDGG